MGKLDSKIRVLGVNAGLGVALFPFKANLVGAIETRSVFHTPKNEQWVLNFGSTPLRRDLLGVIPPADVVISSPDCGSGSILRLSRSKKMGNHRANTSLYEFITYVNTYFPKVFLFENLEGMFKSFPEKDFDRSFPAHKLLKFNVPMTAFGNSQKSRKRLVIVGIRKDLAKKIKKHFKLPKNPTPPKTCQEIYGDLVGVQNVDIGNVREALGEEISIHARRKMKIGDIREEWQTRLKGKKRWESPGYKFSTAPGVYRNLANDYPATARKANRQFDHKGFMLSPRQLARVMGIPDKFGIYIGDSRRNYWINKGRTTVTKGMVYEVAVWFKRCLIKAQKDLLTSK